jgi:hypothetical protein
MNRVYIQSQAFPKIREDYNVKENFILPRIGEEILLERSDYYTAKVVRIIHDFKNKWIVVEIQ